MNLTIIGTGYIGLVTGACFAYKGSRVTCVDVVAEKIDQLNNGLIPIYEPHLAEIVQTSRAKGNLHFTTDLAAALTDCEICFIAVGTPMGQGGSANLSYVLTAAKEIGRCMTGDLIIVDKSTVPVGTADKVRREVQAELDKRSSKLSFSVVSTSCNQTAS